MNIMEMILQADREREAKGGEKSNIDITVLVNGHWYCVPRYCLPDVLWGQPDSFYPCDKYEWANHPLYFTTVEMLQHVISQDESKFVSFLLYKPIDSLK